MKNTVFIKSFSVNTIPNVKPISVFIGETRTHLIITGRNGSGKTSILKAIQEEIGLIKTHGNNLFMFRKGRKDAETAHAINPSADTQARINGYSSFTDPNVSLSFSDGFEFRGPDEVCIFFSANRALAANIPSSITIPSIPIHASDTPSVNILILQHLVNLKAQRAFASDDGDAQSVKFIDNWLNSFQAALQKVFESPKLELQFNRKELNFTIVDEDKRYTFNELSSGQSAILSIYAELLLRIEANSNGSKQISGVILIDEPENHLHASLQKRILNFLVEAFPQFQFIVTTHSPFIVSSLQNTKILNLEDGQVYEDFSSFSYEAILEDYMHVDKYSSDIKNEVEKIKHLLQNDRDAAKIRLNEILSDINASKFSATASAELMLELSSIKLTLKNIE
jgi:predicted ATP-binding protein involved in virulence